MNKRYFIVVVLSALILPVTFSLVEYLNNKDVSPNFELFGKWFIFFAAGLRLLIAGISQVINPSFTSRQIFNIQTTDSLPIVRELGFANICFGILGMISLFFPVWRSASALVSGLYFGIAGIQHLIKGSVTVNEKIALVSDLIIAGLLFTYLFTFTVA